jgi:hypothetical protein
LFVVGAIVAIADEYFRWSFRRHAWADCKLEWRAGDRTKITAEGAWAKAPALTLPYRRSKGLLHPVGPAS